MQEAAEVAHMPDYLAAAKANQSWLAWIKDDYSLAEKYSRDALEIWQKSPMVYPCQWLALWPLIGVTLHQNNQTEACALVRALLEPTQQRFPEVLNNLLEEVSKQCHAGSSNAVRECLAEAISVASKMGYL